jgi:ATP phosphoribosyltransferase
MLRIAVPNKGSLADASIAILKEAGYRQRTDSRDLVLADPDNSGE